MLLIARRGIRLTCCGIMLCVTPEARNQADKNQAAHFVWGKVKADSVQLDMPVTRSSGPPPDETLRDCIGDVIEAILRKRRVPELERKRYRVAVQDLVWPDVERGELKDWSAIKLEAQRRSISHAEQQLKGNVDEAFTLYCTVQGANDRTPTNDSLNQARRHLEYAIKTLVTCAIGGRVDEELADSLPGEVLREVTYLLNGTASVGGSGTPSEQVWAKAITLAATQQQTSIALWWEALHLPGVKIRQGVNGLHEAIRRVAVDVTRSHKTRIGDHEDLAQELWIKLAGFMTEEKLNFVVDVDAYIRSKAMQRINRVKHPRKVDCNTDDCIDPESLVTNDRSVVDMLYYTELSDQVGAIITDADWDVNDDYRRLLKRLLIDRMDEEDVVEASVDELFARPDNDRSREELRKLVRKRLGRAMRALQVAYYHRYVKKG